MPPGGHASSRHPGSQGPRPGSKTPGRREARGGRVLFPAARLAREPCGQCRFHFRRRVSLARRDLDLRFELFLIGSPASWSTNISECCDGISTFSAAGLAQTSSSRRSRTSRSFGELGPVDFVGAGGRPVLLRALDPAEAASVGPVALGHSYARAGSPISPSNRFRSVESHAFIVATNGEAVAPDCRSRPCGASPQLTASAPAPAASSASVRSDRIYRAEANPSVPFSVSDQRQRSSAAPIDPAIPFDLLQRFGCRRVASRRARRRVAAQDPRQGMRFYLLDQRADGAPRFIPSPRALTCPDSLAMRRTWQTPSRKSLWTIPCLSTKRPCRPASRARPGSPRSFSARGAEGPSGRSFRQLDLACRTIRHAAARNCLCRDSRVAPVSDAMDAAAIVRLRPPGAKVAIRTGSRLLEALMTMHGHVGQLRHPVARRTRRRCVDCFGAIRRQTGPDLYPRRGAHPPAACSSVIVRSIARRRS